MSEQMVLVNGVELCVETFGDAGDPTLLLIGGMSSSMDWWEDEFCRRLAAGRRHVVRYDHRDTGRSTTCRPGEPDYTGADLQDDVVGLLDALGVENAHLVGISMGGAMAQAIAVEWPKRVASLTLVDTTAALPGGPGDLPGMEQKLQAHLEEASSRQPPGDTAEQVDQMVEDQRAFMRAGFVEERVRELCRQVVARSIDTLAAGNHGQIELGREPQGGLADIAAPTLVVHGTADPLFPLPHGEALARSIPDARLLTLDGVGHEPPPPSTWHEVVPVLLEHTS